LEKHLERFIYCIIYQKAGQCKQELSAEYLRNFKGIGFTARFTNIRIILTL
jgi:hypothetical protein